MSYNFHLRSIFQTHKLQVRLLFSCMFCFHSIRHKLKSKPFADSILHFDDNYRFSVILTLLFSPNSILRLMLFFYSSTRFYRRTLQFVTHAVVFHSVPFSCSLASKFCCCYSPGLPVGALHKWSDFGTSLLDTVTELEIRKNKFEPRSHSVAYIILKLTI